MSSYEIEKYRIELEDSIGDMLRCISKPELEEQKFKVLGKLTELTRAIEIRVES